MRILAVDDDPDILMLISVALEGMGHEVLATSDPHMALGLLGLAQIDAVVLDIKMPEMSGYEILEILRRTLHSQHVPVVLLSSLGDTTDERIRGLRLGARDFVRKPFDPEEIVVRLEHIVATRRVPEGGFAGDIEPGALLGVLQRLEQDGRAGLVRIDGQARCGWIRFEKGRPLDAAFGLLDGSEAVIGMLDLKSGFFSFAPTQPEKSTETPADGMALSRLTIQLARLHDELDRRRRWLPDVGAALSVGRPLDEQREELARTPLDLPHEQVHERVHALEGITLGELVAHEIAAPLTVCLTTALLCAEGVIEARAH